MRIDQAKMFDRARTDESLYDFRHTNGFWGQVKGFCSELDFSVAHHYKEDTAGLRWNSVYKRAAPPSYICMIEIVRGRSPP
jgi:hypothetical protein